MVGCPGRSSVSLILSWGLSPRQQKRCLTNNDRYSAIRERISFMLMRIIRADSAFDTAEQNETRKTTNSPSRTSTPNRSSTQSQISTTGNRGRTFDQQTGGKKRDRDSYLCPTWWKYDTRDFLDCEFLINKVPSSAYLQGASVAVGADLHNRHETALR